MVEKRRSVDPLVGARQGRPEARLLKPLPRDRPAVEPCRQLRERGCRTRPVVERGLERGSDRGRARKDAAVGPHHQEGPIPGPVAQRRQPHASSVESSRAMAKDPAVDPETFEQELAELRTKIDAADDEILSLLNRRAEHVRRVADLKTAISVPFYVPSRERQIAERLAAANPGPLPLRVDPLGVSGDLQRLPDAGEARACRLPRPRGDLSRTSRVKKQFRPVGALGPDGDDPVRLRGGSSAATPTTAWSPSRTRPRG